MTANAMIFDCDGVLVNSEAIVIGVERQVLAGYGEDADDLTRFVGTSGKDFVAALEADHAQRGQGVFPPDFLEQVLASFTAPKAVASSSTVRSLRRKLDLTNLTNWFGGHGYSSEHVRRGKPAPDLFLHVAARPAVASRGCVVVEDSV